MNNIGIRRDLPGNDRFAQAQSGFNHHLIIILSHRMHGKTNAGYFGLNHLLHDHGHGHGDRLFMKLLFNAVKNRPWRK